MGLLIRARNFRSTYLRRFYISLSLLIFSLTSGLLGFMMIEGYDLNEAFYMTIITISTVGFQELKPLSEAGRIFTSVLIITNIGIFAYGASSLTSFVIEGDFRNFFKNMKMKNKIDTLSGHTIVCGHGRLGNQVCEELEADGLSFAVIETDNQIVEHVLPQMKRLYIDGDATQDEVLTEAGIMRASTLISTLPKDADNVYVTLTAKGMNNELHIISRASEENAETKLKRAGADAVIMPERIGGSYMAHLVTKPDIVNFLKVLNGQGGQSLVFEEFSSDDLTAEMREHSIGELDIRRKTGANLLAVTQANGDLSINPGAETILHSGMKMIVLGDEKQIDRFKQVLMDV